MTILVTGGTGNLGRHVLPPLKSHNAELRVLSRSFHDSTDGVAYVRGDTVTGAWLAEAVRGVDTVLHLAGGAKGDDVAARNIASAARHAGVRHLVLISVVGADAMPIGYFRAKAAAETAIAESGVPFTTLRAAQFHDFIRTTLGALARMPVIPAPRDLRFESVDVTEVAQRLAELTLGPPAGRVADLAGPEVLAVDDILTPLLRVRGRRGRRMRVPLAGAIGRAYREGRNLADASAQRGRIRWEDYLVARVAAEATV